MLLTGSLRFEECNGRVEIVSSESMFSLVFVDTFLVPGMSMSIDIPCRHIVNYGRISAVLAAMSTGMGLTLPQALERGGLAGCFFVVSETEGYAARV